jgi:hypothetical protein
VQLGVVVVVALVVPVVLVEELLLGLLEALLLLGALAALLVLGVLLAVVVPEVVPVVVPLLVVVLLAVVPLLVVPVVAPVLEPHPAYVADASKSFKMLETRPSIVEQELVLLPVDVVPLVVELPVLPELPELLHVVCALAGSEKLANIIKASMTGVTRMVFCSNFLFIQISPLLLVGARLRIFTFKIVNAPCTDHYS